MERRVFRLRVIAASGALILVVGIVPKVTAQQPGCPPSPPARNCTVQASVANDYLVGYGAPNAEVQFEVFDSLGGQSLYGPATHATDGDGRAMVELVWPEDIDLVAGMYVVMRDGMSSTSKTLELAPISIDLVDPTADVVQGTAPAGATVAIGGAQSAQVVADAAGDWMVAFNALGYDVSPNDAFSAEILDDDGDGTIDELGAPLLECDPSTETTCGSAGPDTIRFSKGSAFAGGASDSVILRVGPTTGDAIIDPGTSEDGFVVDITPQARLAWREDASAAPFVLIDGRASSSLIGFLPPRPAELTVKMFGSSGMDLVSAFFFSIPGEKSISPGGYRLIGRGGADFMDAGDGNDLLDGGRGDDLLEGKNGKDVLVGGRGVDWLDGGKGFDICYATSEDVTFGCDKVVNKRHR